VNGHGLGNTVKLNEHHTLVQADFIDLTGHATSEEFATTGQDGRTGQSAVLSHCFWF
jgi:hypothetical protein